MSASKHALSLFSDTSQFPCIPKQLSLYVEKCIAEGHTNRLVEAVLKNRSQVFVNINKMFQLASDVTGLSPDDLLTRTDFNNRDMSPARLDSAFAEIRTINYLTEQGFENIRLLKAGKHKKADILATLRGVEFAIEVVNSIFSANKRVEPSELRDWLVGRVLSDGKTDQLEITSEQSSVIRTILVGVVDTLYSIALNTHSDYCEAAKLTWEGLKRKNGFHIAFVTGRGAAGYGSDDCIFPDLITNNNQFV